MHSPVRRIVASSALVAGLAGSLSAQSIGRMLETDIRNSVGDAWATWTSPIRGTRSDWLYAEALLGGSAAISIFDDDVDRWAVRHQNDGIFSGLKQVREGGVAFSGRTVAPVAVGALALALGTRNQRLQEGLFGFST